MQQALCLQTELLPEEWVYILTGPIGFDKLAPIKDMAKTPEQKVFEPRYPLQRFDGLKTIGLLVTKPLETYKRLVPPKDDALQAIIPKNTQVGEGQYFKSKAEKNLFENVVGLRIAEAIVDDAVAEDEQLAKRNKLSLVEGARRRSKQSKLREVMVIGTVFAHGYAQDANELLNSALMNERGILMHTIVDDAERLAAAWINLRSLRRILNHEQQIPPSSIGSQVRDAKEYFDQLREEIFPATSIPRVEPHFHRRSW